MNIVPISQLLLQHGLDHPKLDVLAPDENNYKALLLQPRGNIVADASGVRHSNPNQSHVQFRRFLDDAFRLQADLAVTPEYSMPWSTLFDAVNAGVWPPEGKLWVLGCESITHAELSTLRDSYATTFPIIFEDLPTVTGRFLDPVAYVFKTCETSSGQSTSVIVVQFKTYPMGDTGHFEINGLQRGTTVYTFGDVTRPTLRLATIICSDAFAFLDQQAREVYDRTLLLHLQLNEQPRQGQYRAYRERLLAFGGDQTELICLNWAKDVHEQCNASARCWNNISGSAWYLRPDKFDSRDVTLANNHRLGLYYTWLTSPPCHALFFNYEPASFLLTTTKVAHIGVVRSVSRRVGPKIETTHTWNTATSNWEAQPAVDDGFALVAPQCGGAGANILLLAQGNPFLAERLLALSVGSIDAGSDWHSLKHLDSCVIGAAEVIKRITFCQDTDPEASRFRSGRLRRFGQLWSLVTNPSTLPQALKDLAHNPTFDWNPTSPHQNIRSSTGRRATVIYLGEDSSSAHIESISQKAAEYLRRDCRTMDEMIEAHQRLHVWYKDDNGDIKSFDFSRYVRFDDPRTESPLDIGRSE